VTIGQNLLKGYLGICAVVFLVYIVYLEISDRWREGRMLSLGARMWFTVSRMFWRILVFVLAIEFWLNVKK
jgi:hypothetical protein